MIRQTPRQVPLYDLHVAARRIFWVVACAGMIVFGTLMGAMFIGQQLCRTAPVTRRSKPGRRSCLAAVCMVLFVRLGRRSRRVPRLRAHAARRLCLFCLVGFVVMLLLWDEGVTYWVVGLVIRVVGAGVGFAGTPLRIR